MFSRKKAAAPTSPELNSLQEQEAALQSSIEEKKKELADLQQESVRAAENYAEVLASRQQDIDRIDLTLAAKREESQNLDRHLDSLKRQNTFESVVLDERIKGVDEKEAANNQKQLELKATAEQQSALGKQLADLQLELKVQKESVTERERAILPAQEKLKNDQEQVAKLQASAEAHFEQAKKNITEAQRMVSSAETMEAKAKQMLAEAELSKTQTEETKTKTKLLYEEAQLVRNEAEAALSAAKTAAEENKNERKRLEGWKEELAAQETDLNRRQRLNGLSNVEP